MSEQANWLDDPKSYPAWACAGELGLSICLQMSAKAIPQAIGMAERFPKVRIILDHCARPVLEDGPPYAAAASLFGLARYPNIYPQADAAHLRRSAARQGDAGNVLCQTRRRIRRSTARLGLELSVERRHAAGAAARRRSESLCLSAASRPRVDFRQDRAGRSTRRSRINGTTMAKDETVHAARQLSEHRGAQERRR